MGAMPWQLLSPYHGDPGVALRVALAEFFEANYDLAQTLAGRIRATEEAVPVTEQEDEYRTAWTHRDSQRKLRRIEARPLPRGVHRHIRLVRRIEALGSAEVGNILDVRGIARRREPGKVYPLSSKEVQALFGTDRPTRQHADDRLYSVYHMLERGEAVCFRVYRARKPRIPLAWYFVGYTVD
jgi:hypothetical protein